MKYLLFYIFFPYFSSSQAPEVQLQELFFKNKTISWQKQYSGYWDEVIPIRFELASDGESCKGFMYFGDEKNKYVITGKQVNNELRLEEQDLNSNITGLIVLQLNGSSAKGTWYNSKHDFNAPLSLKEGQAPNVASPFWIKSFAPKADPSESQVILQKDFNDQISTRFYYKMLNKTLYGTSPIKDEEGYAQESSMEDYLHRQAGTLNSWKINDKKLDIRYKLGNIEYSQSLELISQFPVQQETFADHWMAVDIHYLKIDHSAIADWTQHLIDSFLNTIQNKKRATITDETKMGARMMYRMSIWPQVEFLNNQFASGMMHIKNSWDENIVSIPFNFDLRKGSVLSKTDIIAKPTEFKISKDQLLTKELEKLKSSTSLDYQSLSINDFSMMTVKKEGLAFTAPFDVVYGFRQIVIPFYEIRSTLNPQYFPL